MTDAPPPGWDRLKKSMFRRGDKPKDPEPLRDFDYLNWIRSLPCAHCHAPGPSHPHHSTVGAVTCEPCTGRPGPARGKAQKAHDHTAFPLCFRCHRRFHDAAGPFKLWSKAQRREWQEKLSAEYHTRYFDTETF